MAARQVKVMRGIQLDKVDAKILKEHLDKRGIKYASNTVTSMVEAYGAHVEEEVAQSSEDPAVCAVCGATSMEELQQCPVCGDVDEEEEEAEAPVDTSHRGEIQTTAEPVLAEGDDITSSISRLRSLLHGAMANYWRLGRELLDCYERKLYKTIIDSETNKPRYETWDQFVEAELGITGGHARTLANAARMVNEEQFSKLGVEKVRLASRLASKLPEKDQPAVFAAAVDKSVSELREESRSKKPAPPAATIAEAPPEARQATRKKKVVTCTFEIGKVEIPLRTLEAGKKFHGSEELMDGVRIFYDVVIKAKKATLVIKRERVEKDTAE